MANRFISLEDEIELRMKVRQVYKTEGIQGVIQILGELSSSIEIIAELAQELIKDEQKS